MNLEDCFAVTQNVTGKTVIVVDDIFTTGATMEDPQFLYHCPYRPREINLG